MYAIAVAGFAQFGVVNRVVHAHAAGALDQGLHYHGTDFVVPFGQQLVHGFELAQGVVFIGFSRLLVVGIRRGCGEHFHQQRLVGVFVQGNIAQCQRAQGFAVVAVAEVNEVLLARMALVFPVVVAHLQGGFDGRRTVVGVKAFVESFRSCLNQALGQVDHGLMGKAGQDDMLKLANLFLDRGVDSRIGMAEQVDPPGAHGVDEPVALKVFQPDTFAPLDRDQWQGSFMVFHLGAGMPHGFEATGDEVSIAHENSPSDGRVLDCRRLTCADITVNSGDWPMPTNFQSLGIP